MDTNERFKNTNRRYLNIYIYYIRMENQKIKRGRGRPKVFSDEERKNHKTTYMLNKEWYCDICKTGRNYTLAGKHCHLKTKKHLNNTNVTRTFNI